MNSNPIWETTVKDLLSLFRDSLCALFPIAEKAHIPYVDGDAYDDWDSIASALYTNIVGRSFNHLRGINCEIQLPDYDLVCGAYQNYDLITIENATVPFGSMAVFVGFLLDKTTITNVKWVVVSSSGDAICNDLGFSSFETCDFALRLRSEKERIKIRTIIVGL